MYILMHFFFFLKTFLLLDTYQETLSIIFRSYIRTFTRRNLTDYNNDTIYLF